MEYTINISAQNYKLIQYFKNRVVAINCFPFDGLLEKYDDFLIITWANGVVHYYIENNNIFYQYIFKDFDIDYYKIQVNSEINWDNCFKHWLLIGRKTNTPYINYFKTFFITYINLEERTDRNNSITENLKKNNITKYTRFNAIKKNINEIISQVAVTKLWKIKGECPNPNNEKDEKYIVGMYGCYKSHLTILENFLKQNDFQYLLIMEDDYFIEKNIGQKINECITYIEYKNISFNMLYLSMALFEENENTKTFVKLNNNLLKIKKGYGSTSHAIIYNKNTVKNVIDHLNNDDIFEIDVKLKNIEERYCIYPMLGYQIPDVSNIGSYRENIFINNTIVNYGEFNKMYDFNEVSALTVIHVINIENSFFQLLYEKIKHKFTIVDKINKNKKNIIFGKYNKNEHNSIILSNNIDHCYENNQYIVTDILKYKNQLNVFYMNDTNIESILCSVGLLNLYDINFELNKNVINVVNLSHSTQRYEKFNRYNKIDNIKFIPAIKYNPLFLGCVLSNKMIINNAIIQNLEYVQICEDDAIILDYRVITQSIKYLQENESWDLLSCFNVNIDEEYEIKKIIKLNEKYNLLQLNNWCSTVFNIYNKSCYSNFMDYNENNVRTDEFDKNGNLKWTIDRKINFKNIYLIYPYPVDILDIKSEIWDNNDIYSSYIKMKENSYKILDKLYKNYLCTHSVCT